MEKLNNFFRLLMLLIIGCLSVISANAKSVYIEGLTPVTEISGIPVFYLAVDSRITVSSSDGKFDGIYIDGERVEYNSDSYWDSYSLYVSSYLDGSLHLLELKSGSSDKGKCYFGMVSIDGIIYALSGEEAIVIGSSLDIEVTKIPSVLSKDGIDYSVTSIASYAFKGCDNLHTVTIPESIITIGDAAFRYCASLTSLTFNAVNCISCGTNSPAFPSTISNLTIGNGVTKIPDYFLYNGSKIESLIIPNSVTMIGKYAFYDNTNLKSLTLGSGLLSIGEKAFSFEDNNSSSKIQIPKVFWLSNTPPTNCEAVSALKNYVTNDQYKLANQVKYQFLSSKFEVDGAIYVPISPSDRTCDVVDCNYQLSDGDVVISDKVTNRGVELTVLNVNDYSFYGNNTISSLTLGNMDSTTNEELPSGSPETNEPTELTVGKYAFYGCSALGNASIGAGIKSIPEYGFANCPSLNNLTIPSEVRTIDNYAFSGCSSLANLSFEGGEQSDDATADNILQLGSNGKDPLFSDCPLDKVYIGRKLSYKTSSDYGYSPFYQNTHLSSVEINDAETEIYDKEFFGCNSMKTVKIGNGVTKIGAGSFSGCSSLDYASFGYNVATIGDGAFAECAALKNFYSYAIVPPVCGSQALDDINKWECNLFVPAESSDQYKTADQWKEFFFINEHDAVAVECILLNAESLDGKTGDTFQLTAEVLPANATRKSVEWLSSNTDIVTVDANGLVTFVKEGEATITVSATDGSGVEATINVVVTIKEPELGDSNGNGLINVADAVNIANHAIGNVVEHINEKASDVNQDGVITLADATATISLILEQPVTSSPAFAPANVNNGDNGRDLLVINDYSVRRGENMTVSVALENRIDYVAMQTDVRVPEGMTLVGVNAGERCEATHSIVTRRIDSRTMRVALFDASNAAFAVNEGAILELVIKADGETSGDIEINNIVASDSNAHEYMLASAGGHNSDITGVDNIGSESVRMETSAGTVDILNAEGCEVMIHAADGTMLRRFVAKSDAEHITIVPGVYVVAAGNKVAKVIVK